MLLVVSQISSNICPFGRSFCRSLNAFVRCWILHRYHDCFDLFHSIPVFLVFRLTTQAQSTFLIFCLTSLPGPNKNVHSFWKTRQRWLLKACLYFADTAHSAHKLQKSPSILLKLKDCYPVFKCVRFKGCPLMWGANSFPAPLHEAHPLHPCRARPKRQNIPIPSYYTWIKRIDT